MKNKLSLINFVIIGFMLITCSNIENEYKKVQEANTIQAYEEFIEQYPENIFIENAVEAIDSLRFEEVKSINTVTGYNEFIEKYPETNFIGEARQNIEILKSIGDTIINDRTFITYKFFKKIEKTCNLLNDTSLSYLNASFVYLSVPPGEEPYINDIQSKYGKAHKLEESKVLRTYWKKKRGDLFPYDFVSDEVYTTIHWYGYYGFGVNKDTNDQKFSNKVEWIHYRKDN